MKRNRSSLAGLVGVLGVLAGCGGGGHAGPPDPFARTPFSIDLGFDAEAMAASVEVVDRYFTGGECEVVEGILGGGGVRRVLRMDVRIVNMGDTDLVVGDLASPLPPFGPAAVDEDPCSAGLRLSGALGYLLTAADGTLVVEGRRGAPCLSDTEEFAPGAKSRGYACDFQGLSSGWAAVRRREEPGAWIDVTGLPEGDYVLVLTVDPDGAVPQRLDRWSDTVVLPVHLPGPSAGVIDDHPSDVAGAAALTVPAVVDARFEYAGDVDAFTLTVTAGQPYRVWVEPVAGIAGRLDLRALEDGRLLGGPAPLAVESPVDGLPSADGVVVVRVEADAASAGPYRLHVEPAPPPDDHANAASGASLVVVPSVTEGDIETAGDADWFAVDVVAGRTYTVRTELLTHPDTVLGLYSGDGTILFAYGDDAEGTRASLVVFTAPADGRMTLRVASYAHEQAGSYRLVVE